MEDDEKPTRYAIEAHRPDGSWVRLPGPHGSMGVAEGEAIVIADLVGIPIKATRVVAVEGK